MNPIWKRLADKALIPAGKWLLKQVGLDWVLKRLEQAVDDIGHRQKAILKARSITDGRFGSSIIEERTRWIVYSADEPRAVFPSINANLAEEMRGYDLSRLRRPDELNSARVRAWAALRFQMLRNRLRRRDENAAETAVETASGGSSEVNLPPASTRVVEDADVTSITAHDAKIDGGGGPLANVEEKLGQKAFEGIIKRMPGLLDALSACVAKPAAEQPSIPAAAGVYLFSEGPTPLYVGNTRNLRQRVRQHTGASSRENKAGFAWRLALKDAQALGADITGTRKELESDPEFAEIFRRARERAASMDVRFIEIDDPITRTVFEVYAAQALGTDDFNSFETH